MNKRERVSIFIKNSSRSYLLCRIINMRNAENPDLKITDVSSYGFFTKKNRYDGAITPDVEIDYASSHIGLSYHPDGSPLYESLRSNTNTKWYSNYMQNGFHQIKITDCQTILPIVYFQIRNPLIYKTISIEPTKDKKKVYVCSNDMLFNDKQSLVAVIYVRKKDVPLAKIYTKDYHSDVLVELTNDLDLCIFIGRHTYPSPQPYFDQELKGWITPYPCNSVSFCNQKALFDELVLKLHNNIFDRSFAYFMDIIGDGELVYLTEEKLLILDEIDIFFKKIESPIVHKPQFARFVFEIFKENTYEFNGRSSIEKQNVLKSIWNVILREGKSRNWFNK